MCRNWYIKCGRGGMVDTNIMWRGDGIGIHAILKRWCPLGLRDRTPLPLLYYL